MFRNQPPERILEAIYTSGNGTIFGVYFSLKVQSDMRLSLLLRIALRRASNALKF